MPTPPAVDLQFATSGAADVAAYPTQIKLDGYGQDDLIPHEELNYRWNLVGQWQQYYAAFESAVFGAEHDASTGVHTDITGATITLTGAAEAATVKPTTRNSRKIVIPGACLIPAIDDSSTETNIGAWRASATEGGYNDADTLVRRARAFVPIKEGVISITAVKCVGWRSATGTPTLRFRLTAVDDGVNGSQWLISPTSGWTSHTGSTGAYVETSTASGVPAATVVTRGYWVEVEFMNDSTAWGARCAKIIIEYDVTEL